MWLLRPFIFSTGVLPMYIALVLLHLDYNIQCIGGSNGTTVLHKRVFFFFFAANFWKISPLPSFWLQGPGVGKTWEGGRQGFEQTELNLTKSHSFFEDHQFQARKSSLWSLIYGLVFWRLPVLNKPQVFLSLWCGGKTLGKLGSTWQSPTRFLKTTSFKRATSGLWSLICAGLLLKSTSFAASRNMFSNRQSLVMCCLCGTRLQLRRV